MTSKLSHSHTPSTPTTTAAPVSQAMPGQSRALSRSEMATLLKIPSHLIRSNTTLPERDGELHISYHKYQVALRAVSSLQRMVKDGEWPGKKPAELEVVDLVISKSMWYSHYKALFPKVSRHYPDMLEWLKESADAPSDLDIWDEERGIYTFSSLVAWLDDKDNGKGKKGKDKKNKKDKTIQMGDAGKSKKKKRN